MKYNAIVWIHEPFDGEDEPMVNISIVTPDQKEHEVWIPYKYYKDGGAMPAEYLVHPSCCEHPKGCPGGSRTDRMLEEFNETTT